MLTTLLGIKSKTVRQANNQLQQLTELYIQRPSARTSKELSLLKFRKCLMAVLVCNRLRNIWPCKKQSKMNVPLLSLLQTGLFNLQSKLQ